jgi:hypothetical protein
MVCGISDTYSQRSPPSEHGFDTRKGGRHRLTGTARCCNRAQRRVRYSSHGIAGRAHVSRLWVCHWEAFGGMGAGRPGGVLGWAWRLPGLQGDSSCGPRGEAARQGRAAGLATVSKVQWCDVPAGRNIARYSLPAVLTGARALTSRHLGLTPGKLCRQQPTRASLLIDLWTYDAV